MHPASHHALPTGTAQVLLEQVHACHVANSMFYQAGQQLCAHPFIICTLVKTRKLRHGIGVSGWSVAH
jgi:hypothetical protein